MTYDVGGHIIRYGNRWGAISTHSLCLVRNLRHTCCKILCWRHYYTPVLLLSFVLWSFVSVFLEFCVYEHLTFFEYQGTFAHLLGASETPSVGPPVCAYENFRERRDGLSCVLYCEIWQKLAEHWIQFCIRVVVQVAERFLVPVYIDVMHAEYCPSTGSVVCACRVGHIRSLLVIWWTRAREILHGVFPLSVFKYE